MAGVVREGVAIVREIVEEGFDALFVELLPVGAVAGFLQPVGVEDLFELMANGNGEAGLAEV